MPDATTQPTTPNPLKLARDALQKLACLGNGDKPGNSTGNVIALTTLAAIDAMPASAQTGGSAEHMLQDQSRGLSRCRLRSLVARIQSTG